MRFPMVDSGGLPSLQRTETKLLAHAPFLELLRSQGQARGKAWLANCADAVGQRSTVDVTQLFA